MSQTFQQRSSSTSNGMSDSARQKPHDIDVERALLGSILLDPNWIVDVMNIVDSPDFYLTAHQEIFSAMKDLNDRGQPIDTVLLAAELKKRGRLDDVGGYATLAGLEQFVLSPGAAPELAKVVYDKANLRKLMHAAELILKDCAEESRDVADQIDRAEKLIFDISQKNNVRDFVHIERLMPDAIEEIGRLRTHEGSVSGIRTGYGDLDRYLNGFHPKNLMILAARPSIGKTAFALNLMLNIARDGKVPVAIFSLEMGADQLNRRLMCCHAEISGHAVASGRLSEAEFKRLREKSAELAECPIHIDDSPGLSIMQVRARARRLKNRHPDLGLLVVDYLQLMRGSDRGAKDANRQQEVSEISRGLKELANELSLPVLALSQLSRNIEQRSGKDKSARPMLSDLRESGAIEQDADIVMFVHRDRVETQLNEDGKPASHRLAIPTEIIIGKHRNGPIGTAQLMFFADSTRFASTDPSINYG